MIIRGKQVKLSLPEPCDGLALVALQGGIIAGGKFRIYTCFTNPKNGVAEKREIVKKEYSNGGFAKSREKERNYLYKADYFKGIKYSYFDELGRKHEDCVSNHRILADKIQELIDRDVYLTAEEKTAYGLQ